MYIVYTRILCRSKDPSRRSRVTLNNTPTAVRTLSGNRNQETETMIVITNTGDLMEEMVIQMLPGSKRKKKDNINQTLETVGRCYTHSIGRGKNEECYQS